MLESFLFYSGFYAPMYWSSRQAHEHSRPDPPHHPRRGRPRLLHRLQVPADREWVVKAGTPGRPARLHVLALLYRLYENEGTVRGPVRSAGSDRGRVKKFLRYNANKALMNLGYEALFPHDATVNPAIPGGLEVERGREPRLLLGFGSSYVMGEVVDTGTGLGLLILPTRGRAACNPAALPCAARRRQGGATALPGGVHGRTPYVTTSRCVTTQPTYILSCGASQPHPAAKPK